MNIHKTIRVISMQCKIVLTIILLAGVLYSCSKYLEKKPDNSLTVPKDLHDLQALLDNENLNSNFRTLPVIADDDIYLTDDLWEGAAPEDRSAYVWDDNVIFDAWSKPYETVYYANVVLQELSNFPESEETDNIKGQALFWRSLSFFHLAQLYCEPYSSSSLNKLGIAIRTVPDVEELSRRSTIEETYNRIIVDLEESARLLGDLKFINRPSKPAAYGALARIYLSMGKYPEAGLFANTCLQQQDKLVDYNTLDSTLNPPFDRTNPEIIFYALSSGVSLPSELSLIDTNLYKSYDDDDLRKALFFISDNNGSYQFKGSYSGGLGYINFCGIATDEMFLTRAESSVRQGLIDSANADLNKLLIKRWKNNGTFVPFMTTNQDEALQKILSERRKQLVSRGTRWTDLRRLNLEGYNYTLQRVVKGVPYSLAPNIKKWVWLIPPEVIRLTGMEQNQR